MDTIRASVHDVSSRFVEWAGRDEERAAFVREVARATREVGASLVRFCVALAYLARLIGLPMARWSLNKFRRQPWVWIGVEVLTCLVMLAYVQIRRWLRRSPLVRRLAKKFKRWRQAYEKRVEAIRRTYGAFASRSRRAAALLPHFVFLLLTAASLKTFPIMTHAIVGSTHLTAALIGLRIVWPRDEFWVCYALERLGRGLWYCLPYGASTVSRFGLDTKFAIGRGLYLVWLFVVPGSLDLGYGFAARTLRRLVPSLVTCSSSSEEGEPMVVRERINLVFGLLGLKSTMERVARFVADGDAWLLLVVGTTTFFTVGPVVRFGLLTIAYLLPILTTIKRRSLTSYWQLVALFDTSILVSPSFSTLIAWLPFRSHLGIIIILYLQLGDGASTLINTAKSRLTSKLA